MGKIPDELQAEFVLDDQGKMLIKCPAGHKPYKSRYSDKTESIRASFNRKTCENCPLRERCGAKLQMKSACVLVSVKKVKRAESVKKMQTEEYRSLAKIRNGVEGMLSVMRRKYNVDKIPVRSGGWYVLKYGSRSRLGLLMPSGSSRS
ncbi:MAG: transposase [Desulfosporosinus sp.]|nr:transposase [Desulfosporosinus sp.]